MLTPHVKPGVTTNELDKLAHDYIVNVQQAVPAPLNYCPPGYTPYPKSICTSINQQVCHGIPNDKPLKNGDIVNIDVTVIKDGWHGDTSRMFLVGDGSIAAKRLCAFTYEAMWKGIAKVKPGARLGDIGHAIQTFAENAGFSIVREFCGHGIGQKFHEEPQVLHYGRPGTLEELVPAFGTLSIWYANGCGMLDHVRAKLAAKKLAVPQVRCWPLGVPAFVLYPAQPVYFIQTPEKLQQIAKKYFDPKTLRVVNIKPTE